MSHHLVNLAWEADLPHSQKVVLLALSHLAIQSTGMCSPSVRLLSHMCGLSQSGARSNLKHLAKRGLVELVPLDGEKEYSVTAGFIPDRALRPISGVPVDDETPVTTNIPEALQLALGIEARVWA